MARLFVTEREINFFADIAREVIKDINGQCIFYYPISELKTKTHEIYNEALVKIWDAPIKIDALVDAKFQEDTKIDTFGIDQQFKIEVFVQYRDMIEKGINVCLGDFFSFSDNFYEITEVQTLRNQYGQAEYKDGVKLIGTKARQGQFYTPPHGPTDIEYTDNDAIQKEFYQQRGLPENKEGPTGDVRELQRNGVLEAPLTGQREVSPLGDPENVGSSFYDDE